MIGMWKAFDEMEALGWIGPKRPKMIAVQAEGCQPVVRAFDEGAEAQPVLGGRVDGGQRTCGCRSRWAIFWFSRPCAKAAARRSRFRIRS